MTDQRSMFRPSVRLQGVIPGSGVVALCLILCVASNSVAQESDESDSVGRASLNAEAFEAQSTEVPPTFLSPPVLAQGVPEEGRLPSPEPRQTDIARPDLGTPVPSAIAMERAARYVVERVDPQLTLDVQLGRPAILQFRQAPFRDQVADPETLEVLNITDTEYSVTGKTVGTTVLNFWFENADAPGGQELLSYLVRVLDDEEETDRYRVRLVSLEEEINRAFPNSSVKLRYVGRQVIVRGQAKDIEEATSIVRIVSQSLPDADQIDQPFDPQQFFIGDLPATEITEAGGFEGLLQGNTATGVNSARINNRIVNLLEMAGVHQVMLKVTVAEVNRSAVRSATANLVALFGDSAAFTSFASLMRVANGAFANPGGTGGSFIVDRGDFDLILNYLKTHNLARALAEPTLTTLNGQLANFQVGGSFPVPQITGFTDAGLQGVEFVPFGVQLSFLPTVTDNDRIRLQLQTSVSTRDEATGAMIGETDVTGLNVRQFTNVVELRDGQTLALAGLIQNNLGGDSDRVPFAGDVPFLGRLFSQDSTSYDEQELIVLVTPYLVNPVDAACQPLPLPGSDYYEPDDLEFFLRGSLTGHFAEDYRSPVRTDIHKMKAFRRFEQELIIGQPGHSNGLLCPPVTLPESR